ncbi:tlde1 domain-containing protein [Serratia quinivorans]|uniref:tlde1 domain-containing protein n=1 Tax=Serratia quinivorans TaxID=137545 RepID=UPI0028F721C0|nr:tlde1 domain-containing protein [Serratia quinivorans]
MGKSLSIGQIFLRVRDTQHKNRHAEWFGLYSNTTMSDHVFVNGVNRGSFRLHPLNTDGSGVSWGCITLYKASDFQILRRSLLNRKKVRVPGGRGLILWSLLTTFRRHVYLHRPASP